MSDERLGRPSASSADIFYNCPGSTNLQATIPKNDAIDDSPERQQGTEIAEALETDDFQGLDEDGKRIADKLKEMTDTALAEFERFVGTKVTKIGREERFWIRDRNTLEQLVSAKLDWYAVQLPFACVVDHKTGYIPVTPASRNIQCRIQALCLFHEYPELVSIKVATAQYRFTGKFDAVDYTASDLARAEQELLFNLWRAKEPTAPRVPGSHCRYCRAKGICPEAGAYALLPASLVPSVTDKDVPALVSQLTIEQLAAIRQRKSLIEKIISSVDARLRGLPPEELTKVGMYLAKPGEVRSVIHVQGAFDILREQGLMDEREFSVCCDVVLGRVEEALVEKVTKKTGCTQKEAKAYLDKLLDPVLKRTLKLAAIRSRKES